MLRGASLCTMNHVLIFGMGYTASRLAARLHGCGWRVTGTRRMADGTALAFDDPSLPAIIASASHILSSVPPDRQSGGDPVLDLYGPAIAASRAWCGYLSSTGVYGDTQGAWVDESAPVGHGRRDARTLADLAWQALSPAMHVFRLPGIYGPGRSALDRLRAGDAHRIDAPGHVFSRIHVDDIVNTVMTAMRHPCPGILNVADGQPAGGADVTAYAATLLGLPAPPLVPLDQANLSPMARGFYSECRRIANRRLTRDLGIRLLYPDYRAGLRACLSEDMRP